VYCDIRNSWHNIHSRGHNIHSRGRVHTDIVQSQFATDSHDREKIFSALFQGDDPKHTVTLRLAKSLKHFNGFQRLPLLLLNPVGVILQVAVCRSMTVKVFMKAKRAMTYNESKTSNDSYK
jgi:hypothetical protein